MMMIAKDDDDRWIKRMSTWYLLILHKPMFLGPRNYLWRVDILPIIGKLLMGECRVTFDVGDYLDASGLIGHHKRI